VDLSQQKFYKGEGCSKCHNTGYAGRIGIYEVLSVTDKIRPMIARRASGDDIIQVAKEEGMVMMMQDGLNKVSSGLTTIEEVLRAVLEH
jgi:type IV pilus assembly protein PilB